MYFGNGFYHQVTKHLVSKKIPALLSLPQPEFSKFSWVHGTNLQKEISTLFSRFLSLLKTTGLILKSTKTTGLNLQPQFLILKKCMQQSVVGLPGDSRIDDLYHLSLTATRIPARSLIVLCNRLQFGRHCHKLRLRRWVRQREGRRRREDNPESQSSG